MCAASQLAAVGLALFLIPAYIGYLSSSEYCDKSGLDCLLSRNREVFYAFAVPSLVGLMTSAAGAILLLLRRRNGIPLTAVGLSLWFYVSFSLWIAPVGSVLGGLFLLGVVAMMAELGAGWLIRGNYKAKNQSNE